MPIRILVFSDYICPFCYIGEGIVGKLKQEFDLAVEWRGVEIHPDTPRGGRPLADLFRSEDINRTMRHLRIAGAPFGITFADRAFLSNSRPALQAAEYARDHGRFHQLHIALFASYFSLGLDIGDLDILAQLAADAGLDPSGMKKAIRDGTYLHRVEEMRQEAGLREVTGVPTFFIEDKKSIVGAQPLDIFRKALRSP